jgi:hypothetical protein
VGCIYWNILSVQPFTWGKPIAPSPPGLESVKKLLNNFTASEVVDHPLEEIHTFGPIENVITQSISELNF